MTELQARIDRVMELDKKFARGLQQNSDRDNIFHIASQLIQEWPEMVSIIKELQVSCRDKDFQIANMKQNTKDVLVASLKTEIEVLDNILTHKEKERNFWKGECHKEGMLSAEKDAIIAELRGKLNDRQSILESARKRIKQLCEAPSYCPHCECDNCNEAYKK